MPVSIAIEDLVERPVLSAAATCRHDEIGTTLIRLLPLVFGAAGDKASGQPLCRYSAWRESECDLEALCPIAEAIPGGGEVRLSKLQGGPAAVAVHVGPYDRLHETHMAVHEWAAGEGYKMEDPCWEEYVTDPGDEPDPSKWVTRVIYPVKK